MNTSAEVIDNLQHQLGRRVRELRRAQNLSIDAVAASTSLAEKSVRNLELGRGTTTETLFKVLAAVGAGELLDALVAPPSAGESTPAQAAEEPLPTAAEPAPVQ